MSVRGSAITTTSKPVCVYVFSFEKFRATLHKDQIEIRKFAGPKAEALIEMKLPNNTEKLSNE